IGLVGFFLPVGHEASRSLDINTPPDRAFALLADVDNYLKWWSGATVKSEVVERVPPSKIVTRVVGETQFGGTWTIDITPIESGSRITITERGEVYNVVFRTLSRFVFGHTATMESCLEAVRKRLS
ncbi:MAG: hypothetical protein RLZZ53_2635, partial [Acidobacteriota bacterium]